MYIRFLFNIGVYILGVLLGTRNKALLHVALGPWQSARQLRAPVQKQIQNPSTKRLAQGSLHKITPRSPTYRKQLRICKCRELKAPTTTAGFQPRRLRGPALHSSPRLRAASEPRTLKPMNPSGPQKPLRILIWLSARNFMRMFMVCPFSAAAG